jgi:chitin disaccharide deacetylase
MKKILLAIFLLNVFVANAQTTLQEKLGYPKNTKLLIIHGDDLGVSHSENMATIAGMEKGSISSASIMVPTPWFPEIAAYARAHPKADFGLHLTLTAEWKNYKWGPVASKEKVPGIINKYGFMYESVDSVQNVATAAEVETEIRAQIEQAKQFGIDITHLDSHMGTLFFKQEYLRVLIILGREYKLPVLLVRQIPGVTDFTTDKDVVLDNIYIANPPDFKSGMDKYYSGILKSLQPGVSEIILHAAYDDSEMQGVTIDHADYGAAWRQADYNFFSGDACKKLLKENNIRVITWREIRDKLVIK